MMSRRSLISGLALAGFAPRPAAPRVLPRGFSASPPVITPGCTPAGAIPVTGTGDITGPGCYQLMNDVGILNMGSPTYNNVTLFGNNHAVGTASVGFWNYDPDGLVVQDLTINGPIRVYGNSTLTQTPLATTLRNVVINDSSAYVLYVQGNNVLLENITVNSHATATDDSGILWTIGTNLIASWVTFDGCFFGPNFDVGLEGVGGWDHVTVKNCVCMGDPGGRRGIGGWYYKSGGTGPTCFSLDNCTFFNNTIGYFAFTPGGPTGDPACAIPDIRTDAAANALYGPRGNVFGLPAGPPNIYLPF